MKFMLGLNPSSSTESSILLDIIAGHAEPAHPLRVYGQGSDMMGQEWVCGAGGPTRPSPVSIRPLRDEMTIGGRSRAAGQLRT